MIMKYAVENEVTGGEEVFIVDFRIFSDADYAGCSSWSVEIDSMTLEEDTSGTQVYDDSQIWKDCNIKQDELDVACYEYYTDNVDYDFDGEGYYEV